MCGSRGGIRGPDPLGKSQVIVIWVSIGPPPLEKVGPPWKCVIKPLDPLFKMKNKLRSLDPPPPPRVPVSLVVLGCVDAVLGKKVEFRPIDPIPRVWGGRRGEVNNFSVMLGHPTLYWASLPYFPTDHKSPNNQESMLGFVVNCIFFNSFVMFYDSVTK